MNHPYSVFRAKKNTVFIKFISVCSVSMNIVTDVSYVSFIYLHTVCLFRYQIVFNLQLENWMTTHDADDLEVKVEKSRARKREREIVPNTANLKIDFVCLVNHLCNSTNKWTAKFIADEKKSVRKNVIINERHWQWEWKKLQRFNQWLGVFSLCCDWAARFNVFNTCFMCAAVR